MGETVRSHQELMERAGPVDGCDACMNNGTMKIDGLCVKHFAVKQYGLKELKSAHREYEEFAEVRERASESSDRFRARVEAAFPERRIHIRTPHKTIVDGETIAWFTNKNRYGRLRGDVFHADKYCPNFPSGGLIAHPIDFARSRSGSEPCSYCTIERSDND